MSDTGRAGRTRGTGRVRAVLEGVSTFGLVILGLVGILVVGWYVFSLITGARLVVFMTGSMAPDLPAGSAAVSLPVPASELAVGDVVTVQRDDASLPVTHRIVEIEPGADPATRLLSLQGDDNPVPDQFSYAVDEAHRLLIGAPHAGTVLDAVRSPGAIMALTAMVAALVLSAFWPERTPDNKRD